MTNQQAYWKLETQIKAFINSGLRRSKFTRSIYEALYIDSCRFNAHCDIDGFYKARFESPEKIRFTMESLATVAPSKGKQFGEYDVKRLLRAMPSQYAESIKTWRLGNPIFRYVNNKCGVFFDSSEKWDYVTNLMNCGAYLGRGVGMIKTVLEMTHAPIVTNCDSMAYDWIRELPDQGVRISQDRLVIFVSTGTDFKTNGGYIGASEKRLKTAQEKLKGLGYKTKYFSSLSAAKVWIEKQSIQKTRAA